MAEPETPARGRPLQGDDPSTSRRTRAPGAARAGGARTRTRSEARALLAVGLSALPGLRRRRRGLNREVLEAASPPIRKRCATPALCLARAGRPSTARSTPTNSAFEITRSSDAAAIRRHHAAPARPPGRGAERLRLPARQRSGREYEPGHRAAGHDGGVARRRPAIGGRPLCPGVAAALPAAAERGRLVHDPARQRHRVPRVVSAGGQERPWRGSTQGRRGGPAGRANPGDLPPAAGPPGPGRVRGGRAGGNPLHRQADPRIGRSGHRGGGRPCRHHRARRRGGAALSLKPLSGGRQERGT